MDYIDDKIEEMQQMAGALRPKEKSMVDEMDIKKAKELFDFYEKHKNDSKPTTVSILINKFVLVDNESGRLIAIDRNSGGYPYTTDSFSRACLWNTRDEALGYYFHFPSKEWSVFHINYIVMEKA